MKKNVLAKAAALGMAASMIFGCTSYAASGVILDNGRYEKLVVAISEDPQDLEPDDVNVGSRYNWIYGIYEPLFDFADDNSGELLPCIAASYEEEDDGASWLVTMNEDVYDWDGNNIVASDVEFCFNWMIENGQAIRFDYYDSIEVVDDYHFYFHWTETPPAINDVEFPIARTLIVSEKAFEDHDGMATNPCGTGCYKVTDFVAGSKVVMEANDDYWGIGHDELSKRHTATVQTYELDVITEASTAVIALETDSVDVCSYVPLSMLDEFETGALSEEYKVDIITEGDFWYFAPNAQTINKELREAMFYALDNETICTAMGGSYTPATTFGTEAFTDYDESLELTDTYVTDYDLDKAAELVEESGYDGRTLQLLCVNNEAAVAACTMIQLQLAQVGINVEINAVTNDSYNTLTSPQYSDQWDMMINTLGGTNMVNSWHLMLDNEVNGGMTFSLIEDDELQDLYKTATADETHDAEHMRACLDYVVDNAYLYPMAKISNGLVYTKDISEMFFREGYYTPGAATFSVD